MQLWPFTYRRPLDILVLGFYDRGNLGDELYKSTIPSLFKGKHNFTFKCTDDVATIPKNVDVVICGGGDIINDYFMSKVKTILATSNYVKPIYAVSVGVQTPVHLHVFDHVFVRSTMDYAKAVKEVGTRNVTLMRDCVFNLPLVRTIPYAIDRIDIGFSLARPILSTRPDILAEIARVCNELLQVHSVHIHLFVFNTHAENTSECDFVSIESLILEFPTEAMERVHVHFDPEDVVREIGTMRLNICMRYHSCVLSIAHGVRFIALSTEPKVTNLLYDIARTKPFTDLTNLVATILKMIDTNHHATPVSSRNTNTTINDLIISRKTRCVMMHSRSFEMCLHTLHTLLKTIQPSRSEALLGSVGVFNTSGRDPLDVARLVAYAMTGSIENDCIWGLASNMQQPNFCLSDAVGYIYSAAPASTIGEAYFPVMKTERRCRVRIDPYASAQGTSSSHRSGWKYVVDTMMNVASDEGLLVDTYVDRTFHWGSDVMNTLGVIPYHDPWIGFIHHTFDETYSKHNTKALLENAQFKESLNTCRGLIVLSNYLAKQLRDSIEITMSGVPIHVLTHPTEFVPPADQFTFKKFLANPRKKLVQIGAWLRRPYSLYMLDVQNHSFKIQKAALKGKNMSSVFAPEGLTTSLQKVATNCSMEIEYVCGSTSNAASPTTINKYVDGLLKHMSNCHASVEVINTLDNAAYDKLMSENIVFLDLVDCSAVNTVLECIVRKTPLIVNRHPALEEILGVSYPGFYTTLYDAAKLVNSAEQIKYIYKYMKLIDKSKLHITTFMKEFQDIVVAIPLHK